MPNTDELADEVIDLFEGLPKRVDKTKIRNYARAYAEYILSRVADDLDRDSAFSSARKIRDKIDQLKAEETG